MEMVFDSLKWIHFSESNNLSQLTNKTRLFWFPNRSLTFFFFYKPDKV